ncbi:hypothetical protein SDC9_175699 [bioreactor metagenome]|uniref:Uncharacterized protein n=1 Tax=bioreactor metagenome TaxID=1076179 RepID=A0A645GMW8_9ZZZZ
MIVKITKQVFITIEQRTCPEQHNSCEYCLCRSLIYHAQLIVHDIIVQIRNGLFYEIDHIVKTIIHFVPIDE